MTQTTPQNKNNATPKTPAKSGKKEEKRGEQESKRDDKGRFLPGHSGNPEGPPVGHKKNLISTAIKKFLETMPEGGKESYAEMIAKRAVLNALAGNAQFFNYVIERTEGKVTEEFKGELNALIAHGEASPDRIDGLVESFVTDFRKKLHERQNQSGDNATN